MDAAFALARNVVDVNYAELPAEARDFTKMDILDILGTAIAGGTAPGVEEVTGLAKEWGGRQESTIIGFGCRIPSPNAALVNATMAHALDYDDTHDQAVLHAGVSVIPASFAIAEREGKVDGKKFITAVALGIDVVCRMGIASKLSLVESGWVYTSIYGYFGATAAAGKILGLGQNEMVSAFGIAYSQAAGNMQCIEDAVLSKRMQPGFAAKGGVISALLASRGVTGSLNSFEGRFGIYNVYHQGRYDPLSLTSNLGSRFEVSNLSFKPYPTCRYSQASIDATLALVREHDIKPEDIEEINVITGENTKMQFEPLERKRQPRSVPDSQWSIPWAVATAAVKRRVGIEDFTLEAINNPDVLRMAQRVNPHVLAEFTSRGIEPARVEIKTSKGEVYVKRVDYPKGNPRNRMTMEDLADKFRDCALRGRKHLARQKVEGVIQSVSKLEEIDDVGKIIQLLG